MLALLVAGCRPAPPPQFTTWAKVEVPEARQRGSSDAFDTYLEAAEQVRRDDALGLSRVNFTAEQKRASIQRSASALRLVRNGTRQNLNYRFIVTEPFAPNETLAAWRHLGRMMGWEIENSAAANAGDTATRVRELMVFAHALMQGGAPEADTGLALVDEARIAILNHLDTLDARNLRAISEILKPYAADPNWLDRPIENEAKTMRMGVQWVQDAFLKEDWKKVNEQLGTEVVPATKYLSELRHDDGAKQIAYFQGFAAEVDIELKTIRDAAAVPAAKREKTLFIPEGERPWKRFSKHFFRTLRPLLSRYDLTLTRTKLLILECMVRAQVKASRLAPTDLSKFDAELTTDPLTGQPFGYSAVGPVYKLYSIGMDQQDNGGVSDTEHASPDLTLEYHR